ncbi:tyrosine-type recombinase/integrase [Enterococcus olivae]
MKFCEWYLLWYETYRKNGKSPATLTAYENTYRLLKESYLGNMDIDRITSDNIQSYINVYGESRMKKTVRAQLFTLKSCFEVAKEESLIKANPVKNIELVYCEKFMSQEKLLKIRNEKKWLELDEYNRTKKFLVSWLDKCLELPPFPLSKRNTDRSFNSQPLMMIIFIALKTGMRFGEILGITRLDISNNKLSVNKTWSYNYTLDFSPTKNLSSIREITLDQETVYLLKKYIEWLDRHKVIMYSETIFVERNKKNINNYVNRSLQKLLTSLSIERISFHKLRHTHATILLAQGINIDVVAKRLGHSDTTMVRTVYGHLLNSVEKEENKKIINLI